MAGVPLPGLGDKGQVTSLHGAGTLPTTATKKGHRRHRLTTPCLERTTMATLAVGGERAGPDSETREPLLRGPLAQVSGSCMCRAFPLHRERDVAPW